MIIYILVGECALPSGDESILSMYSYISIEFIAAFVCLSNLSTSSTSAFSFAQQTEPKVREVECFVQIKSNRFCSTNRLISLSTFTFACVFCRVDDTVLSIHSLVVCRTSFRRQFYFSNGFRVEPSTRTHTTPDSARPKFNVCAPRAFLFEIDIRISICVLSGWLIPDDTKTHYAAANTLLVSLQTTASSSFTSSYSTWTAFFSMIFCCCCCQFRFGVWSKAIDPSWWIEMLLFCGGWFSRLTSSAEKF